MRSHMWTIHVEQYQISALACFNAADLVIETQRSSAVDCRHSQHSKRGQRLRAVQRFLDQRSSAHLGEHIQAVVARRAIRPERNRNPSLEHLKYRSEP